VQEGAEEMKDRNYWQNRERQQLLGKRFSRRRLIQMGAAGSAGAVLLATGCGGSKNEQMSEGTTAGETPKPGGQITIGSPAAVSSLDPAIWSLGYDKYVTYNVFDWPVTEGTDKDGNLTVFPNLAESFEWVDNTHLHFAWRQGIKFHDGVDFNSDAIQAYYARVLDPATKSPRGAELRTLDHVESPDAYNSTYVLKEPDAVALSLTFTFWTSCIPSPAAKDLAENPVGTGPFIFKSQQPGASYELVKNPDYWRPGEPYLDSYSVRVLPDKAVAAAALKAGEVDFAAYLETRDVAQFRQDSGFSVSSLGVAAPKIYVNSNRGACKDERVRKALSLAIDRDDWIARYAGEAFMTPGPLVKGGALANPDEPDPVSDLEQARQLLAAAGYQDGLQFERLFTTTDPGAQTDAEMLQAQWEKAGIKVNVEYVATAQAGARLVTGDYELALGGTFGEGDDYELRNVYYSKGVFNGGTLTDSEVDRLIDSAKLELDPNERKKIYWQVQKRIMDQTLAIFIIGLPTPLVLAKRVQGYAPDLAVKGDPRMQYQWRKIWLG
jgi:peptide/nickel transport system substrate-binding protein